MGQKMKTKIQALNPIFAKMFGERHHETKIRVEDADPEEGTIYLYDAIGGWFGMDAKAFVQELMAMKQPTIHMRINSPGGDVFDARAIQAAIRTHSSRIVAHIDGLAASAASFVALSASKVEMNRGAFLMIHNAQALCIGDCNDMTALADTLNKVDKSIVADYAAKTGIDPDEIQAMMNQETWLDCDDALAKGFCDCISEDKKAENKFDLSVYAKVPEQLRAQKSDPGPVYDHAKMERRLKLVELGC